ncbi:MAG TPA: hypothetical protein VE987_20765 [Polyangiaceae bacterium]|nr:hypothetical protein [Polyangiaceae bacterium]
MRVRVTFLLPLAAACVAVLPAVAGCSESMSDAMAPAPDAAPPESGATDAGFSLPGDASACRPGDVETYQPAGYTSATAPGQGVCVRGGFNFDPIQGFYEACLGPAATAAKCASFKADPATSACARCILTADTDAHYGPLVDHGGFITPNVAGCIELTDPRGMSCAKAVQALSGCELAACEANCPVHDAASLVAYDACADQADVTGCASYSSAAGCVAGESDSGAAACLATSFVDFYDAVVPLFCGPAPSRLDAGALFLDAALDAASEPPDGSADASRPGQHDAASDAASVDAPAGGGYGD